MLLNMMTLRDQSGSCKAVGVERRYAGGGKHLHEYILLLLVSSFKIGDTQTTDNKYMERIE